MGDHERLRCRTSPCRSASCGEVRCRVLARRARTLTGEGQAALTAFCESSWASVHAFVRAHGYRGADADDLTQAWFARFIERGDLAYTSCWTGSIEGFLRVSVRHFLANERDRERARKRGGGIPQLSLDAPHDDPRAAPEPKVAETPESELVQARAEGTIRAALDELRREMQQAGCAERLARVEDYLLSEVNTGSYRRMADEWGVGEGAARVTVHRLRRRLGRLLRRALARPFSALDGPRWA